MLRSVTSCLPTGPNDAPDRAKRLRTGIHRSAAFLGQRLAYLDRLHSATVHRWIANLEARFGGDMTVDIGFTSASRILKSSTNRCGSRFSGARFLEVVI